MRGCAVAGPWRGVVVSSVTEVALVEETLVCEVEFVFWVAVEEGLGFVSAGEEGDRCRYAWRCMETYIWACVYL